MSKASRTAAPAIPEAAIDWVRSVFGGVNHQVASTLSRIPTHHEPELDMQFIAALNRTPAVTDISGWTVYIETHFLGGRRHFFNWEVADIGLLVIFRTTSKVQRIKVGLLQSKRLYPRETKSLPNRTRIGFGTLLQDPAAFRALAAGRKFAFRRDSKYRAVLKDDDQQRALTQYQKMSGIPVYYLFYNPVEIPWTAQVPAATIGALPEAAVGCRVVPCSTVFTALGTKRKGYVPSYNDIAGIGAPFDGPHLGGWRLEHFVADKLLRCLEGYVADEETDHVLEQLFYRRSGPISAAIAVTIEAPPGVDLVLPETSGS